MTPPGFHGALQVDYHPAVTVPLAAEPLLRTDKSILGTPAKPGLWWLNMMGRLKPGATEEQARQSLNSAFQTAALEAMPPPRKSNEPAQLAVKDYPRLLSEPGDRGMLDRRKSYVPTIYGLFIVVALVLLIACANLANLLLARATLRRPEISVRLAVGAGRRRLVGQLLTESLLLATLGGAAGVVFAVWAQRVLLAITDTESMLLPKGVEPSLNWRVLVFTLAVSLVTAVLFGLVPAWQATSLDLSTTFKESGRTTGRLSRLSKALLVVQVAVSALLLAGAGLFIRTLYNLQNVSLGFNQENLLVFRLQPEQAGYKDERLLRLYEQLFDQLDHQPGVRAATFGRIELLANSNWLDDFVLPGETLATAPQHETMRQMVRENYFATTEIPFLRGRQFTAEDNQRAPAVAIVNQTFMRMFFPNEDVLGKHITFDYKNREVEIVGLVADAKYSRQREQNEPVVYTPWRQEAAEIGEMHFALRTTGNPAELADHVREVVRRLDSNLPVTQVGTQTARSEATLGQERLYARLLTFFGVLALLLATIGLFGVLTYSVGQRTKEIGVRLAFGAQVAQVIRLVVWQGMKLVLLGLVLSAFVGYVLKRLLERQYFAPDSWQRQMAQQLYGVKVSDPLTLIIIAMLLTLVALLGCWLPARRAAKVDPLVALRYE